ncbi:MAG TPA: amidohydrolase family protein [Opitutaceae bacterium]
MPIIDAHVHLYPPEVNRDPEGWAVLHREPHWAALCTRRRRDGRPVQAFPDVATLLGTMDAAGVDRAVLVGWYWENPDSIAAQNRFYARCIRAYPDRLSAFATVHPHAGDAALAEVRWAADSGFAGLGELSPHSQHVATTDPRLQAILALAGDLGLPVNLHVTDPTSRPYPGRIDTPLEDCVALARAHPRTTFILAHWGGGIDLDGLPNVYVDTAAAPLIHGATAWTRIGKSVPAGRVLFGSDYPLNLYPRAGHEPEMAAFIAEARACLPAEVAVAVLGGNAQRVLGGGAGL